MVRLETRDARPRAPPKGKGMQLGSKGKQNIDVLKALEAEDDMLKATLNPKP